LIVRMCVVCRQRINRDEMLRLQCQDENIIKFSGHGRSFYLCKNCINDKKLGKIIQKICKVNKNQIEKIITQIKEIEFYEQN